ncbi:MAG: hypothetical protein QM754_15445 [Tepidisphaeraceae bacterium]
MTRLLTKELWAEIDAVAKTKSAKRAAIAYVSSDRHLSFGKGDTLFCDATDNAISGGLTSARVLEQAFARGARLMCCPHLHAKVMVLDNVAIIGSGNCSKSSAETLIEAAMLVEDSSAVEALGAFVDSLEKLSSAIDDAFIARIKTIPVVPRRGRGVDTMPSGLEPSSPSVVTFYKQVMMGDVKKHARRSNKTKSGGGA